VTSSRGAGERELVAGTLLLLNMGKLHRCQGRTFLLKAASTKVEGKYEKEGKFSLRILVVRSIIMFGPHKINTKGEVGRRENITERGGPDPDGDKN